jgi:hypothetical protein
MLREAKQAGLMIDPQMEDVIVEGKPVANNPISRDQTFVRPDSRGMLHRSLNLWWWLLELWPKQYQSKEDGQWAKKWKIPLGRRRSIPDGSMIHTSVEQRIHSMSDYKPRNLPVNYTSLS